jgi:hypothetical protein
VVVALPLAPGAAGANGASFARPLFVQCAAAQAHEQIADNSTLGFHRAYCAKIKRQYEW